jgi:enoyl-CoA hydratase/carnithine racemase
MRERDTRLSGSSGGHARGRSELARLIPYGVAAEMIFTGKMIDAEEAYRIG